MIEKILPLYKDPDRQIPWMAFQCAVALAVAEPEPILFAGITDPYDGIRTAACWQMGNRWKGHRHDRAEQALEAACVDPMPGVRSQAIRALVLLQGVESLANLRCAESDPSERVRTTACQRLGKLLAELADLKSLPDQVNLLADHLLTLATRMTDDAHHEVKLAARSAILEATGAGCATTGLLIDALATANAPLAAQALRALPPEVHDHARIVQALKDYDIHTAGTP